MNIVNIGIKQDKKPPFVPRALFTRMEGSLKNVRANFEKNIKLAKTLAPILQDQSSNERHMAAISSEETSIQEKIISIIMLGFPKNRPLLPFLQNILMTSNDSMRIAAAIAIAQMRDGFNNETLGDVLLAGFKSTNAPEVAKAIRQAYVCVADGKTALALNLLLSDKQNNV
ncbi:MAG: hypothetical protein KC505_10075 [Myxococcales bacterium]|nr:hypothetical protein [Myxococcales bacterium]USN49848.1 MAG: hypothetical protein H6731_06095 [Myxococcales bacterium]